jgi:hypothetical protein
MQRMFTDPEDRRTAKRWLRISLALYFTMALIVGGVGYLTAQEDHHYQVQLINP